MIFPETRVAVTPFQSGYRLGSTMEFAGYDATIDPGGSSSSRTAPRPTCASRSASRSRRAGTAGGR